MHYRFVFLLFAAVLLSSCDNNERELNKEKPETQAPEPTGLGDITARIEAGDTTANMFFQRARLHFEDGDLQAAAGDIITAIRKDSSEIEYFYLLSDIQLNAFQSRRALQSLEKAVSLEPNNRTSLLKLMELQILLRQYIPAINTSQKLLSLDPQDDQVFFLRGLLFKEQNEDSLAIINLQRTVDLNPEMTDAFIMLGDLHEKKSSHLAGGYYRNAVNSAPENMNALHAYAFYLQNHDEMEKALEIYDRMMAQEPESPAPFINSAVLYMEKDSFKKAEDLLIRAQRLDSTFALTPFYLGKCYVNLGRPDDARQAFLRAIKLDPEFGDARKELENL